MKKFFALIMLLGSSVFAQVSEKQAKEVSYAGAISIVFQASNLELWNDNLVLQTDEAEVADMKSYLKTMGVEVLSGIYGNQKTGLIVANVKLVTKNDEISVMVFDTSVGKMYFYNISAIADGLVISKDDHYSDLLFKITK